MQPLSASPSGRTLTFPIFCTVHPTADMEVVGIEAPDEHSAVSRAHARCTECGLVWSFTATAAPAKDHVAERLGVNSRHPMKVPRLAAVS